MRRNCKCSWKAHILYYFIKFVDKKIEFKITYFECWYNINLIKHIFKKMATLQMKNLNINEYRRHDALSEDDINTIDQITNTVEFTPTIYRFKFTEDFMAELYNFAKIHQYDHRKDFKEAWVKWSEDNSEIIMNETERLLALGYQNEDNIDDKMFKSARYYFRKKSPIKPEPKQRRQYISVDHDLLAEMDRHITNNIYHP